MEQVDEKTRIYNEGEHIIQKIILVSRGNYNEFGGNIECPYGYKLLSIEHNDLYNSEIAFYCIFVNEVAVKCKLESNETFHNNHIYGYFKPGEVIKENSLRKKY